MLAQYFLFFYLLLTKYAYTQDVTEEPLLMKAKAAEDDRKLSVIILEILSHYKNPEPVGLPGVDIPDQYAVPDTELHYYLTPTIYFKNITVHGLSKFKIVNVNCEISTMQVQAALTIDKLQGRGNYKMEPWLNAERPFVVDVTGLEIKARAGLSVEQDGKLRAQDIVIDLGLKTITAKLESLGFFRAMIQSIINFLGRDIFNTVKPYFLNEAHTKARNQINSKLDEIVGDIAFSNSVSPIDIVIANLRNQVRNMDLDPYRVEDYHTCVSFIDIQLAETWITGISSFYRIGNITLKMVNNTATAEFKIGTQQVEGKTVWKISAISSLMSRSGAASFSVEYISARLILGQPLDIRKKPEFRNLEIDIGNIHMRCDGAGTIDYIIESIANFLPNLLRNQITNAIEELIKEHILHELEEIDVEQIIIQKLQQMNKIPKSDFQLSTNLGTDLKHDTYDRDDFFNF